MNIEFYFILNLEQKPIPKSLSLTFGHYIHLSFELY